MSKTTSEPTPNPTPNPPPTFEAGLQELESIVKEMETGELPLERAITLFEQGMKLSEACRKQLEEAETRVEILTRRAGEIQPQPFKTNEKA
ncbi:MAG: exodeoxyribonuclease VII small subunit [Acidobacteriia bacterium]|nr:exodeoxyribonuclease VII small subunit [Terriglobia bacterium]